MFKKTQKRDKINRKIITKHPNKIYKIYFPDIMIKKRRIRYRRKKTKTKQKGK